MIRVANTSSDNLSNVKNIFKGTLISIIISIVLLFNFSAILTYTKLSETTMPTIVIIITIISILIGSQITTSNVKKRGIINGGLVGLTYMIILYLISTIITKEFGVSLYSIIMLISSIFAGAVGGIIGINRKKYWKSIDKN